MVGLRLQTSIHLWSCVSAWETHLKKFPCNNRQLFHIDRTKAGLCIVFEDLRYGQKNRLLFVLGHLTHFRGGIRARFHFRDQWIRSCGSFKALMPNMDFCFSREEVALSRSRETSGMSWQTRTCKRDSGCESVEWFSFCADITICCLFRCWHIQCKGENFQSYTGYIDLYSGCFFHFIDYYAIHFNRDINYYINCQYLIYRH